MIFSLVVIALLSACRNEFDFEEAHRANPVEEFKYNFETIFGKIAPDQSWDFSGYDTKAVTRAGTAPSFVESSDWYYVEDNTLKFIQTTLNPGIPHTDEGRPFAFAVPESGEITVYPIYQGTGMSWELHMVVGGTDTAVNGFWQKGKTVNGSNETVLQKNKGKNCVACQGTGLVEDLANSVTWNNKVFAISKWWLTAGTKYFSGEGSGFPRVCKRDDSPAYFAVIKYKGNNYLYYIDVNNIDNNGFVTINNNKISIEKTYSEGAILGDGCVFGNNDLQLNNGALIIGGKKIGVIGGLAAWFSSWFGDVNYLIASDINKSATGYSYDWSISGKSYNYNVWGKYDFNEIQRNNIVNSIKALNGKKNCSDCDHGKVVDPDGWINVGGGTFKDDNSNVNNTMDALAVRTRGYKFSGLEPGASVYFYAKVTQGVSIDETTYGVKDDIFVSTGNYMIKLDNAPSISNLGNKSVKLCALEDYRDDENIGKKDKDGRDFESLVFMVVSDETSVSPYNSDGSLKGPKGKLVEKRYMVEDLGAVASSDIDFNDVVFDICEETEYKLVTDERQKSSSPYGMRKSPYLSTQNLIIRAMGGTLDFGLNIGGAEILKKSDLKSYNTKAMYKTGMRNGKSSLLDYDGIIYQETLSDNPWIPENNNVSITVYKDENTTESSEGVLIEKSGTYTIPFPNAGEAPCIIAFPVTKMWRDEGHQFCNEWLKDNEPALWEMPENTPDATNNTHTESFDDWIASHRSEYLNWVNDKFSPTVKNSMEVWLNQKYPVKQ